MTTPDYDVVIVGARAAGASTAMLLARHGHRVLLLDRAKLPSEIAQGHTRQFAMAGFGALPREVFFNPDNLERIMAQASNAA